MIFGVYADNSLAAQDTAYTADLTAGDANVLLRTRLQSTNSTTVLAATDDYRLQVEKNASGVWSNVDAGSVAGFTGKVSSVSTTGWATVGEAAQSFLGDGRKLVRAGFWLQKNGSPPGNVIVRLYAHTGTYGTSTGLPTGSPLATSTSSVVATSLPTPGLGDWFFFAFDGTFTMAAGTAYCMVVTTDTLGDTNNDVQVGYYSGGGGGYEGNAATRPPAGAWTANTGQDFLLRVQSTPEAVADGYDETNYVGATVNPTTVLTVLGQSFLGNGGALTRAGFWLGKIGSPTGNMWLEVRAHTGTYGVNGVGTGPALATSTTRAQSTLTTPPKWEDFTFDGTFTLVAGTPYVIVLVIDAWSSGNTYTIGYDNSSPTHPGNRVNSDGTTWFPSATEDRIFRVCTVPSVTLPYDTDTNLRDADPTTNRLGAGTGSFTAGRIAKHGQADDFAMVSSNYTELLYALTLKQVALANGDTLRFRVLWNGSASRFTYTQVPTIPVTKTAAPRTGQPKVWTDSAFVNKPAKVWTGSAWVEKPVKVWSGTAWVLAK
jgi:hypothetical protein